MCGTGLLKRRTEIAVIDVVKAFKKRPLQLPYESITPLNMEVKVRFIGDVTSCFL